MRVNGETTAVIRLSDIEGAQVTWLYLVAAASLVLNLLDAIFTLVYVSSGAAVEANPVMATLLDASPLWFMVGKLMLVSLGVELLWRFRSQRLAAAGLCTVLGLYAALACYHLSALEHLAAHL